MKQRRVLASKHCVSCGGPARNKFAVYCTDCAHRAGLAASRAALAVRKAIEKGKLTPVGRKRCVDCGERAKFYDHRNYKRPLTIVPVCHSCNVRRGPAAPFNKFMPRHSA